MTRSRSWTHLTRTATKIPRWSCSCYATTSLCGPVTRRATGTNHRKAATTNLPKLKSFLILIRTSYSLSSPRPPEVLTHVHPPDPSIHPSACPLVPRVPRFLLPSFQSQLPFPCNLSSPRKLILYHLSLSLSLSRHDRTLLPMPSPQLLCPVQEKKTRTFRVSNNPPMLDRIYLLADD